ncbi:MAG: trypco2 family protein [Blastococcus sp.]
MGVAPVGDGEGWVPIAEFVTALRAGLKAAQASRNPRLQFAVGPVAVEFTLVTGREGAPEGKVRFWVLEAGGSAKWSQAETQKVSLTLTPVDEHGR